MVALSTVALFRSLTAGLEHHAFASKSDATMKKAALPLLIFEHPIWVHSTWE